MNVYDARMQEGAVRQLAQSDPVPNMNAQWGQAVADARADVTQLTSTLRRLDKLGQALHEQGVSVVADLGPIGNAAAAARRDLERDTGQRTFQLPRKETP